MFEPDLIQLLDSSKISGPTEGVPSLLSERRTNSTYRNSAKASPEAGVAQNNSRPLQDLHLAPFIALRLIACFTHVRAHHSPGSLLQFLFPVEGD